MCITGDFIRVFQVRLKVYQIALQVADIKRANGFQSDTAMFGKDTLLIPTKPLPLGYVPPHLASPQKSLPFSTLFPPFF